MTNGSGTYEVSNGLWRETCPARIVRQAQVKTDLAEQFHVNLSAPEDSVAIYKGDTGI
jgi:hypothetical protein